MTEAEEAAEIQPSLDLINQQQLEQATAFKRTLWMMQAEVLAVTITCVGYSYLSGWLAHDCKPSSKVLITPISNQWLVVLSVVTDGSSISLVYLICFYMSVKLQTRCYLS